MRGKRRLIAALLASGVVFSAVFAIASLDGIISNKIGADNSGTAVAATLLLNPKKLTVFARCILRSAGADTDNDQGSATSNFGTASDLYVRSKSGNANRRRSLWPLSRPHARAAAEKGLCGGYSRDVNQQAEADPVLTEQARAAMPFAAELGIELISAAPAEVRARLAWAERLCTAGGILHGGVLMGLADAAGAYCAFLNLPEGAGGTATIESKTNFFRAVRKGHVYARSRPLHSGRTTIVVETDLHDDAEKHIARVTQTQAVL